MLSTVAVRGGQMMHDNWTANGVEVLRGSLPLMYCFGFVRLNRP